MFPQETAQHHAQDTESGPGFGRARRAAFLARLGKGLKRRLSGRRPAASPCVASRRSWRIAARAHAVGVRDGQGRCDRGQRRQVRFVRRRILAHLLPLSGEVETRPRGFPRRQCVAAGRALQARRRVLRRGRQLPGLGGALPWGGGHRRRRHRVRLRREGSPGAYETAPGTRIHPIAWKANSPNFVLDASRLLFVKRRCAKALARASSPSFLRALPAKLESTRTRAESLGGTSTTDSPAAANLPARYRPRPPEFSSAQRRSGNRFAQRSRALKPARFCGKRATHEEQTTTP